MLERTPMLLNIAIKKKKPCKGRQRVKRFQNTRGLLLMLYDKLHYTLGLTCK